MAKLGRPRPFSVTYSTLSATSLAGEIAVAYDLASPVRCVLWHRGLNDTYLVHTANARYTLRVYRTKWRTFDDILYELDLLLHLQHKGVPVSTPLVRKDGRLAFSIAAPEGSRFAVLFTYARGTEPSFPQSIEDARRYGRAVAEMHNALDAFASAYERFRLDLHYLIAQPMRAIVPFLAHRLDDRAYLQRVADCLKERVTGVADTLDWGACHGDTHGGNCHVAEDGTLILFDFDCCGPGWRAFDLATYRWETCLDKITDEPWTGFLEEYGKCRTLAESNLAAVPLFVALRHIWIMGLHTGNAHDWSHGWLTDRYFDRALKFLREWVDGQISDLFGVASGGTT